MIFHADLREPLNTNTYTHLPSVHIKIKKQDGGMKDVILEHVFHSFCSARANI